MRRFAVAIVVLVIAIIVAIGIGEITPPRSVTDGRMHMMKRRIIRFAIAHGFLSTSVDQLPRIEGFDNGAVDGWGRPITLRVEGATVTLTSYGSDGIPGGAGDDRDMIGIFLAKTATGQWADEFCEWELDPYGRQRK
jgi:hypothetical protein